jgi:hypothetical protein
MFGGENLEDLKLEELSQKLEAIEKDNEQIRRENQLFESYILRKTKDDKRMDDDYETDKNKSKKRQKQNEKVMRLNAE